MDPSSYRQFHDHGDNAPGPSDKPGLAGSKPEYVAMPHFLTWMVEPEDDDVNGTTKQMSCWELVSPELHLLKKDLSKLVVEYDSEIYFDNDDGKYYNLVYMLGRIQECMQRVTSDSSWDFEILDDAVLSLWREPTSQSVQKFLDVFVFILESALNLPKLFPEPLKLLQEGDQVLTLSREQICCIMANAFFCTFPDRNGDIKGDFVDYPRINFINLYDGSVKHGSDWRARLREAKVEKLKCFLNYFSRMRDRKNSLLDFWKGLDVTFERKTVQPQDIPDWGLLPDKFSSMDSHLEGCIEKAIGSLQVDFANEFVGGGTLGNGAAMEEIRFSCCPELVAAQLFTKQLGKLDTLLISHFEQFSTSTGYADGFKFVGNYHDVNVKDNYLVAMDAHQFPKWNSFHIQLKKQWVDRELNKCFSAFKDSSFLQNREICKIASGKWGCGVFNGDPLLKSIIQWIAASHCKKHLDLFTFRDKTLCKELTLLKDLFSFHEPSIGEVYSIILEYGQSENLRQDESLLEYIQLSLVQKQREVSSKENKPAPHYFRLPEGWWLRPWWMLNGLGATSIRGGMFFWTMSMKMWKLISVVGWFVLEGLRRTACTLWW